MSILRVGNTFSTLSGISFEWTLLPDTNTDAGDTYTDPHNILRFIDFKDSNYDTPERIETMESKGLQGDTILVEGVKTGSAYVQVKLTDPAYKVTD